MTAQVLHCSKCHQPLPASLFNSADFVSCPSCNSSILIRTFPALEREPSARAAESVSMDEEASCFFHPQKKAVDHCDSCGRFLCSLCSISFLGGHLCPACLEAGKKKKKIKNLETHRVLYDNMALSAAILPILFFWITIITAPVSVYLSLRHWKSPTSILPRTKARFIAAIAIAGFQIAAWLFIFAKAARFKGWL